MIEIDNRKLLDKFMDGKPLNFRYHYFDIEKFRSMDTLLLLILAKFDLMYFVHSLEAIIRELITNAYKANLKRLYFNQKQLEISAQKDYQRGIKKFIKEVYDNIEHYNNELKENDLFIQLTIQRLKNSIIFKIVNNVPVSGIELKRIEERLKKAVNYDGFLESYNNFYDLTEGAGLGIHMVYFLLKNSGIDPSVFQITSTNNTTQSVFKVPYQIMPHHVTTSITKQIMKEVELLPTLPAHIIDLIRLCKDPEFSISDITDKIISDPSLTADVFKLANSASMSPGRRIENVGDAIVTMGTSNLQELLYAVGSRKILAKRYTTFENIWNHCQKTAFYASHLAKKFRLKKISGKVYLAGLLHDLGKIILLSVGKDITNKIAEILTNRVIKETTLIEEVTIGISHSEIGALIARKWNFPDYLDEAIHYHHSPLLVEPHLKDLTYITYLSNMLCGIEANRYEYAHLEEEILLRFNMDSENTVYPAFRKQKVYNNLNIKEMHSIHNINVVHNRER